MKTCTKCKEEFPATLEFFSKHKTGKFGLRSWCKKCMNKDNKKWHQNNSEKVIMS